MHAWVAIQNWDYVSGQIQGILMIFFEFGSKIGSQASFLQISCHQGQLYTEQPG